MARPKKNTAAPAAAVAAGIAALTVPGLDAAHSDALVELSKATHDAARNNFMFVQPVFADALAAAGFAEVHPTMTDEQGNKASRSTATGDAAATAYIQAKEAAAAAPAAAPAVGSPFSTSSAAAFGTAAPAAPQAPAAVPAVAPTVPPQAAPAAVAPVPTNFKIAANVPIPEAQRFGKTAVYPFDALQVGQSFFVAASEKRPNPAKSVASTVNSANKRLAPRNFAVRRVDDGAPWGFPGQHGAGVWRLQ